MLNTEKVRVKGEKGKKKAIFDAFKKVKEVGNSAKKMNQIKVD